MNISNFPSLNSTPQSNNNSFIILPIDTVNDFSQIPPLKEKSSFQSKDLSQMLKLPLNNPLHPTLDPNFIQFPRAEPQFSTAQLLQLPHPAISHTSFPIPQALISKSQIPTSNSQTSTSNLRNSNSNLQNPNLELRNTNLELKSPNLELKNPNSELKNPSLELRNPNSDLPNPNSNPQIPIPIPVPAPLPISQMTRPNFSILNGLTKKDPSKHGTAKHKFTPEEDAKLIDLVKGDKPAWNYIETFLPGRTARQCRERWLNVLDPSINHKPWSDAEAIQLNQMVQMYGQCWSKIAKFFPGRTDVFLKNKYIQFQRKVRRSMTSLRIEKS